MITITQFGSCRSNCANSLYKSTGLNEVISYTHTTKEHLQLLDFIEGRKEFPYPFNRYCFRTSIISQPSNVEWRASYAEALKSTDLFLVELCSTRLYMHSNYYLHHLAVDRRFDYWRNTDPEFDARSRMFRQDEGELEEEMLELEHRLRKPMIFLTHFDAGVNGMPLLLRRRELIQAVERIGRCHGLHVFNPSVVLGKYKQSEVLDADAGHYTMTGTMAVGELLSNKIKEVLCL